MLKLDSYLEIAKSAAIKGGEFILSYQNKDLKILVNQGRDIKLQLDADTEDLIKEILLSSSSLPVLGEETGASNELNSLYWVVDPLDGTSNFLRQIPICCVSIALMKETTPILGVIYDFNHHDLYYGHIESKAYLNHSEISVSNYADMYNSTLVTGIPARKSYSNDEFKAMIDDFQKWKKVRMIGSAAMASVYVASGKAETYKENGVFLWDVAAGAAIVNAAGGVACLTNLQTNYRVNALFTNKSFA